jgi:hypothetical protein
MCHENSAFEVSLRQDEREGGGMVDVETGWPVSSILSFFGTWSAGERSSYVQWHARVIFNGSSMNQDMDLGERFCIDSGIHGHMKKGRGSLCSSLADESQSI